jgi:hypothetical protein
LEGPKGRHRRGCNASHRQIPIAFSLGRYLASFSVPKSVFHLCRAPPGHSDAVVVGGRVAVGRNQRTTARAANQFPISKSIPPSPIRVIRVHPRLSPPQRLTTPSPERPAAIGTKHRYTICSTCQVRIKPCHFDNQQPTPAAQMPAHRQVWSFVLRHWSLSRRYSIGHWSLVIGHSCFVIRHSPVRPCSPSRPLRCLPPHRGGAHPIRGCTRAGPY